MRSSPRRIAGAVVTTLGVVLSVLAVLAPAASASVNDPDPRSYTGNPGCASFGLTLEAKIDEQPTAQTYEYDDLQKSGPVPTDVEITISNVELVAGRMEFDWSSNYEWSAVLVKQANGGLAYEYEPAVNNDQNVQTVAGSQQGGISHVTFCAGVTQEPTTGALSVDKVVVDDEDPQDPNLAFGFEVACTDEGAPIALGDDASFTLTDAADPRLIEDLPTGAVCTVTETISHEADGISMSVDGDDPIPGNTVSGIIIGDDTTVAVVATNTYGAPSAAVLAAEITCGAGGLDVTVSNTGNADGTVDVLSGGNIVADDVLVPAGGSAQASVPVSEESSYEIEVTGVETFTGVRDCETVEGAVVRPTTPAAPTQVAGAVLPRTGGEFGIALAGLGLIVLGAALTFTSRRQLRSA